MRNDNPLYRISHFHYTEQFPIKYFARAVEGYLSTFMRHKVSFTAIFLNRDDEDRIYAGYRFPDFIKNISEQQKEICKSLENYKLYMDDAANEIFSIYKLYEKFKHNTLKVGEEPLNFKTLSRYLTDNQQDQDSAYIKNFIREEGIMVEKLIPGISVTDAKFLPIPIFALGQIIGVIYFISDGHKDLNEQLKLTNVLYDDSSLRNLLLNFTRIYERVIQKNKLNFFSLIPEDPLLDYYQIVEELKIEELYKVFPQMLSLKDTKKTPKQILKDLRYDEYYSNMVEIFIDERDDILEAEKVRLKTAITAIVVDSFSHNIGAHCLIALKWWFEQRSQLMTSPINIMDRQSKMLYEGLELYKLITQEQLREAIANKNDFYSEVGILQSGIAKDDISFLGILLSLDESFFNGMLSFNDSADKDKIPVSLPFPVDYAIYSFFEYLRNKSAYWSGATRDTLFSGRVQSWFELLKVFINNPLFLGTIAYSEGVYKINIYLEFLNQEGSVDLAGEFAIIDFSIVQRPTSDNGNYQFLLSGKDYENIKAKLKSLDPVFLPGDIIGEHAFFNLLENTLRDVKHYKYQPESFRKEGLKLYISIQEVHYLNVDGTKSTGCPLYKVGTWLHHPQLLISRKKVDSKHLPVIEMQARDHMKRIFDEDGRPRLGGGSQDKVNSALLMNNTFESVGEIDPKVAHLQYYPYIFPATERLDTNSEQRNPGYRSENSFVNQIYQPELRPDGFRQPFIYLIENDPLTQDYIQNIYKPQINSFEETDDDEMPLGLIKRYFHIWKGAECLPITYNKELNFPSENPSRFKIIVVNQMPERDSDAHKELMKKFREMGIIRIVSDNASNTISKENAQRDEYSKWLGFWIPRNSLNTRYVVSIVKDSRDLLRVVLEKNNEIWNYHFLKKREIRSKLASLEQESNETTQIMKLKIAHGSEHKINDSNVCNLRSHGSFLNEIFPSGTTLENLYKVKGDQVRCDKFLETIFTHITIFDNRIHKLLGMYQDEQQDPFDPEQLQIVPEFTRFRDQLNLEVYPEAGKFFGQENQRKKVLAQTHFLIMHLQFVESMWKVYWDKRGEKESYSESEVNSFFDKEIKWFYEQEIAPVFPPNLILVITSGRGRTAWLKDKENFHPQITFRPIESLVNAVEDGLALNDDYQVKHNLCNVLFGS